MTVLSDVHLTQLAAKCGIPAERINPASIDLSIGPEMVVKSYDPLYEGVTTKQVDLREHPMGYHLMPGQGALLHTEHTLEIPNDKTGLVMLKSSRSREFMQQMSLGLYDPGFKGQGVIQIAAPVIPVVLSHQQLIAQLVLLDTYHVAVPYGAPGRVSHYQHQKGAKGSVHTPSYQLA